mgnify:CR=1 FL=1
MAYNVCVHTIVMIPQHLACLGEALFLRYDKRRWPLMHTCSPPCVLVKQRMDFEQVNKGRIWDKYIVSYIQYL